MRRPTRQAKALSTYMSHELRTHIEQLRTHIEQHTAEEDQLNKPCNSKGVYLWEN
jgi:hypothetical protein